MAYKQLDKGEGELVVTVDVAEMQPYVERATKQFASELTFDGFRPGTAPFALVRSRVGEMKLWEHAAELAVARTYADAVRERNLETIGSPRIDVQTLAPGNPLTYKATMALLPEVGLGDRTKVKVDAKVVSVPESDVEKTLAELQKMRVAEALQDRPATTADKVIVDLHMAREHVPLEGGQTKNHSVVLNEPYYIPGFTDQLVGMKKGEAKTFTLTFPHDHYQKHLAGKPVDFTVTMQSVYSRAMPEVNDAFAQGLGQASLTALKDLLRKNIADEQTRKEEERQEIALLEQLVSIARFGPIPDLLVTEETHRMLDELERSLTSRGLEMEKYLESIKKTREQLLVDFAPDAVKRVKTALLIRTVAREEHVTVTDAELAEETEKMLARAAKDAESQQSIRSDAGQDYLRGTLKNRKVIALLKTQCITGSK